MAQELYVDDAVCQLAAQYNAGSGQLVVSLATYGTGYAQFPASLLTGGAFFRVQAASIVFKVTAINTSTNQWTVTVAEGTDANVAVGTAVKAVFSAGSAAEMHQLGMAELTMADMIASSVFPSGSSLPALPNASYPSGTHFVRTSDQSLWQNQGGTWVPVTGTGGTAFIYYASKNGCALNTSLASGGGTDDTAALQAILNVAASGAHVKLILDGPALVTGLNVYGNTTIECLEGAGLYLANNSKRAILRNVNRSRTTITDQHITMIGGYLNGNSANQVGIGGGGLAESDNTFITGLQFYGVNYLTLRDVTAYDARCYSIHLANVNYVTLENLRTDYGSTLRGGGQDGVHINGPASFVYAHNCKIRAGDDAFALNAGDTTVADITIANNMGPYVGQGLIQDAIVDGLELDGCQQGVRLLSHNASSRIHRVLVKNVRGTVTNWAIANLSPFGTGAASFGEITLDDFDVTKTAASGSTLGLGFVPEDYQNYGIGVAGAFESLTLRNIKLHQPGVAISLLWITSTATINSLTVDGLSIYDDQSGAAAMVPVLVDGHVKNFRGRAWNWYRSGVPQTAQMLLMSNAASQIDMLSLNGMMLSLVNNLVRQTAGSIGYLQAVSIHHDSPGGNPTFYSSAGTITEIDISNWFGSSVFSGTATVKKGDGFLEEAKNAGTVFAGPASGSSAQPAFRALTPTDIPDLSSLYAAAGSGSSVDHLHGLARWVAAGGTTFDLPDIAEYLERVSDNGSIVDATTVSLSADRTQVVFDSAPTSGHVLQAEYVIGRL